MIKAVIFDLWGTLIFREKNRDNYENFLNVIGKENKKKWRELYFDWWFTNDVDEKTFFEKVCDELSISKDKLPDLLRYWELHWGSVHMYKNTLDVLKELRDSGLKIGIVSNTSKTAKSIFENMNLRKYFDVVIFSFEVGITKPDEKIYLLAAEKLKIKPEECLFIGDDVEKDVAGPRKVGMKSFLINRKYHGEDNIQSLRGVIDLIDWE